MFLGDVSQETLNPGNGCFLGGAGSRELRPRLPGAICGGFSRERILHSRSSLLEDVFFAYVLAALVKSISYIIKNTWDLLYT